MKWRYGCEFATGFFEGSWNNKYPDLDRRPNEKELLRYFDDQFKKEESLWQCFIVGASSLDQREVENAFPLRLAKINLALEKRIEYRENEILRREWVTKSGS